ncbi:Penicillin-binding protein 4* [Thalassoglobus neptunius]|uniref:Penicillin-binding protein 4 n=1 Tax=Thalassoglobus neptunius TaxID=1938619 RepID=A0A5C5WBJ0_9PLAN|nr:serine hydrolase domain-containing protein [Thalassoglobus neptunius]TWT47002.1 Penicillin-binding protein 4* [Thalassoglobus neptunius]
MNFTNTPLLQIGSESEVGLNKDRWSKVLQSAQSLIDEQHVPGLAFQVQRGDFSTQVESFGQTFLTNRETPISAETPFLIASLSKPMVAMTMLMLVERGALTLNHRVSDLVPEFRGAGKRGITIKNVLTHTSGLLDMLPNNRELRSSNSSILEFVKETGKSDLAFPTATNAQYQSMGFALLAPVVENVTGRPLREFIRTELFEKIGMHNSWLGIPESVQLKKPVAEVRVPDDQIGEDHWNWNSNYWKTLGAPWGGVVSPVEDVSRFCRWILAGGKSPDGQHLLKPETIRLATSNRLRDFPNIPDSTMRCRGWGYGWRMNWTDHRGTFTDLANEHVFGHWGATGTLMWIDPNTQTAVVILSTHPASRSVSPLVNLSNQIVAAFESTD